MASTPGSGRAAGEAARDAGKGGAGSLKSRLRWALLVFAVVPLTVFLWLSDDELLTWVALAGFPLALAASMLVARALTAPVDELRQRLRVKNYGADGQPESGGDAVGSMRARLWQWLGLNSQVATGTGAGAGAGAAQALPVELAEIERLARAGRVSELAMESVKKDLFRHLSHQLKSPMALLRAHSQMARRKWDQQDRAGVEDSLATLEELAMNVSGLVETLLSMAWVEGLEERGLGRGVANLSAALMQVSRFREALAGDKDIKLRTGVDAGLWVVGEQQLLQEMVSALVDNAIRYSPRGSEVRLEARRVATLRAIIITVTDQGPGIPESERDRVFEPFYGSLGLGDDGNMLYGTRRHRALADGMIRSSHGLGLSLVRAVARLHRAEVSLESGPGGKGLSAKVTVGAAEPPQDSDVTD